MHIYKVHHTIALENVNECFVVNSKLHDYQSRARCELRGSAIKLDIMKNTIRVKCVYIWNFV